MQRNVPSYLHISERHFKANKTARAHSQIMCVIKGEGKVISSLSLKLFLIKEIPSYGLSVNPVCVYVSYSVTM